MLKTVKVDDFPWGKSWGTADAESYRSNGKN